MSKCKNDDDSVLWKVPVLKYEESCIILIPNGSRFEDVLRDEYSMIGLFIVVDFVRISIQQLISFFKVNEKQFGVQNQRSY